MRGPATQIRSWMYRIMDEKGWNAEEWARKANTSPTNITRFLKGSDHIPSYNTLVKLATAAGVAIPTPGVSERALPSTRIPLIQIRHDLLTSLEAISKARQGAKEFVVADYLGEHAFAVKLDTSEFRDLGYMRGDILIVDPDVKPRVGKHVLAFLADKRIGPLLYKIKCNAIIIGTIVELIRTMI